MPDAGDATVELWQRLARPFPPAETVDALAGLGIDVVEQLAGVALLGSSPAQDLLAALPGLMRSLTTSMNPHSVRSRGGLTGPVLWSETMSARSASFGDPDLFVCTSAQRDYDTAENRVLVSALDSLANAGRAVERVPASAYDDEGLRQARASGRAARRYLEHPVLVRIPRRAPTPRELRRARQGKAAARYRPAFTMLERAREPLDVADVLPWCDRRTRRQHEVLLAVLDELARRGMSLPAPRAEHGALVAGPVRFIHPRRLGARDRLHGILLGDLLVDVPAHIGRGDRPAGADPATRARDEQELAARAHGHEVALVRSPDDVPHAVDLAIRQARRSTTPKL